MTADRPEAWGLDPAALRRAFDERFREAPETVREEGGVPHLVVREGQRRLAVPLSALGAVLPCGGIEAVPEASPHLIGLTRTRLGPMAVVRLGPASGAGSNPAPRWLLVSSDDETLGAGCDEVLGLVLREEDEEAAVVFEGAGVPVVDLTTLWSPGAGNQEGTKR